MRADRFLFEHGFARSRTQAAELIRSGSVYADGRLIDKASSELSLQMQVEVKGGGIPYVSRGGYKLEAALTRFVVDVTDAVAIDFGASTGGFTDCLLQNGARKVYAIDSGRDQLDETLRHNPAVISLENTNARYLSWDAVGELCDIAVMDLSFISQTLLHPVVVQFLKEDGRFITLIKPQFEVGKSGISKGGIVKDEKMRRLAVDKVISSATACGLKLSGLIESPIRGGDGNIEFLACFTKRS